MSLEINGNKIIGSYSANSQITVFGGSVVTMAIYGNRTANAITGFKIGTTPGGSEVYSKATISGLETNVLCKPELLKQFFDIANDQTLYITATNWNGATLGLTFFFEFITG